MEIILGFMIGWLIGLIALVFFEEEIFEAIDWMRDSVRRALGLD